MLILFQSFAQFAIFPLPAKSDLNETPWALSKVMCQLQEFVLKSWCITENIQRCLDLLSLCMINFLVFCRSLKISKARSFQAIALFQIIGFNVIQRNKICHQLNIYFTAGFCLSYFRNSESKTFCRISDAVKLKNYQLKKGKNAYKLFTSNKLKKESIPKKLIGFLSYKPVCPLK